MVQAGYKYADNWQETAPRQNKPQVRRVRKTYRRISPGKILFKIGITAFAYGLILVFLCLKASTLGYQIVQLETDIHQLESSNQRLQYEIEKSVALDYVENYALTQLGMDKAKEHIKVAGVVSPSADTAAAALAPVTMSTEGEPTLHKIYASLVQFAGYNQ